MPVHLLSQTDGPAIPMPEVPEWSLDRALEKLDIRRVPYEMLDANASGYSYVRNLAISPVDEHPLMTAAHEVGHVLLGQTDEGSRAEYRHHRGLMEFGAESVAYLSIHERGMTKPQAGKAGIGWSALGNGFACCDDPARLQQICDRLGPAQIQAFFGRWMARLPLPLTQLDRAAGYWWELSMRQKWPALWCSMFLATDGRSSKRWSPTTSILGQPEQIDLIFGRQILPSTPGVFATRVVTRGVDVCLNVGCKHSCSKQYFKQGRTLRIETVVNDPADLGVLRRLIHLPELQRKARDVNRRLLDHEHVGQGCLLASPAFERIARPSQVDGRRAPALRFGDPRVQALPGALAITAHLVGGFSNKTLRPLVAGLLGEPYSQARCCYDLRRLRMKGLIIRLEHSNTYVLTNDGQRFAIFYTKLHNRLLRPLLAANQPPAPLPVRQALKVLDHAITDYIHNARIAA
jgi:hypothetical protein